MPGQGFAAAAALGPTVARESAVADIVLGPTRTVFIGTPPPLTPHALPVPVWVIGVTRPVSVGVISPGGTGLTRQRQREVLVPAGLRHTVDAEGGPTVAVFFEPGAADLGLGRAGVLPGVSDPLVLEVLDTLHEWAGERPLPGADDLALALRTTPAVVTHRFHEAVGAPLRHYRLWVRIRHVGRRLAGGQPLAVAASAAGLTDAGQLTQAFRDFFGLSPTVIFRGAQIRIGVEENW